MVLMPPMPVPIITPNARRILRRHLQAGIVERLFGDATANCVKRSMRRASFLPTSERHIEALDFAREPGLEIGRIELRDRPRARICPRANWPTW